MARKLEVEVANFVCRFGAADLIDRLNEIVLPAFFSEDRRKYMETEYFFTNQSYRYLARNDPGSLALCCRFVKDTIIRRHQIYSEEKGIVSDEKSLPSAPSSVAVLILQSHRLLFVREVPNAPSMVVFGSTFAKFMRSQVMNYRESLFEQRRAKGQRVSKKAISGEIEVPDVRIVPVVHEESLRDFVARFEVLNNLRIEVAPTNNELDNENFFRSLRTRKQEAGSSRTVIQHTNPKGLDKDGCIEQVKAAKQGNLLVEMRGKDETGDVLKGNNDEFSVRAALPGQPEGVAECADAAFTKYNELLNSGSIEVGQTSKDNSEKLKASYRQHSTDR